MAVSFQFGNSGLIYSSPVPVDPEQRLVGIPCGTQQEVHHRVAFLLFMLGLSRALNKCPRTAVFLANSIPQPLTWAPVCSAHCFVPSGKNKKW